MNRINRIECVTPMKPIKADQPIARKVVITELDPQFFLEQIYYQYKNKPGKWYRGYHSRSEYAAKTKGRVRCISAPSGATRYMEYLCQYEGFFRSALTDEEWSTIHIQEEESDG